MLPISRDCACASRHHRISRHPRRCRTAANPGGTTHAPPFRRDRATGCGTMSNREPPSPVPSAGTLTIIAELARIRAALNASAQALEEIEKRLRLLSIGKAL